MPSDKETEKHDEILFRFHLTESLVISKILPDIELHDYESKKNCRLPEGNLQILYSWRDIPTIIRTMLFNLV